MATCYTTSRTNYFRVTDEERYQELYAHLVCGESVISDFTETKDGVIWHGFGAYDEIRFEASAPDEEDDDDDCIETFMEQLQEILPEDEAFMLFTSGHEKLRYVVGDVYVCTKSDIRFMSIDAWAKETACAMLGPDFTTKTMY